jgi:polyisoprenoid-binding protein YceI
VQSALATGEFPTASFTLTEPIELPAGAADGDAVQATAVGDLTVKGATNPVELALEAQLVDGTVVVVGSVEVTFSEWGVEVPSAPIVLSAADVGTMELQLLLVRA